jgi:hypothetical protein
MRSISEQVQYHRQLCERGIGAAGKREIQAHALRTDECAGIAEL